MSVIGNTVNIFIIIELFNLTLDILGILYNSKGNGVLEGEKAAVGIGEGDNTVADKEILVSHIKVIFFKLAHLKSGIAESSVK